MKKRLIIYIPLISLLLTICISARDIPHEITEGIDTELDNFQSSLPDFVKDFFESNTQDEKGTILDSQISEKSLLTVIIDYLTAGIGQVLKGFSSILLLLIISGIFNTFKSSVLGADVGFSFSVCSALSISLCVFNICTRLTSTVIKYTKSLSGAMNAFVPIMVGISIMSGSTSGAVASNSSMLLFISLVDSFLVKFMMPLVTICLCFGCVGVLSSSCDFGGISKTVKTTFSSVTVFVMSVFMFVFSFKSKIASGSDSLSLKTARFAISSFVPLVGASVNDALKTVTAGLSLIKTTCGSVGIISIIVLMMPVIVNLFLNKISFSLLSSLSKMLGLEKEGAILSEADSICGFLLTIVSCTCVLFIIALTIFISTGVEATL